MLDELFTYFKNPDPTFSSAAVRAFFSIARRCVKDPALRSKILDRINDLVPLIAEGKNPILAETLLACVGAFLMDALSKGVDSVGTSDAITQFARVSGESAKKLSGSEAKIGLLILIGNLPTLGAEIAPQFVDNFMREDELVQIEILECMVKLYLAEANRADELLTGLFERVNRECPNPMVRDQAFLYWRMLT